MLNFDKIYTMIMESDPEEEAWYKYYEVQDEVKHEILSSFAKSKLGDRQPWTVIPFARLSKIWNDYANTGIVRDVRGLESIKDIVIRNIAKVTVNTELAGHTQHDPIDDFEEYDINEVSYPIEDSKKPVLDFGDYILDEHRQWRISDSALKPLHKLVSEILQTEKPEQQLVLIDRILNICHQRSDIASWFIEGGDRNLSKLSGMVEKEVTENTGEYMTDFNKKADEILKWLNEDGEAATAPADAMSDAGYVDASVNNPSSKDAIYTVARPYKGKGKKLKKARISLMRRNLGKVV